MLRTSKQKRKSGNPRRTICARSIATQPTQRKRQLVTKCLFCFATNLSTLLTVDNCWELSFSWAGDQEENTIWAG